MHFRTHTKPESIGQSGRWQSPYHDTMIDHDRNVGTVLKVLDDLGIADNTFVMYSTDNGPHMNSWPDGAMTPFRSEKNSNWEGAYRVPAMVRRPGHIKPGSMRKPTTRACSRSIRTASLWMQRIVRTSRWFSVSFVRRTGTRCMPPPERSLPAPM
jgi:membrane-anchored protein YejM (alkaline phosphatase superfamily)